MLAVLIACLFLLALLVSGTVVFAMIIDRFDAIILALIGEGAPPRPEAGFRLAPALVPAATLRPAARA